MTGDSCLLSYSFSLVGAVHTPLKRGCSLPGIGYEFSKSCIAMLIHLYTKMLKSSSQNCKRKLSWCSCSESIHLPLLLSTRFIASKKKSANWFISS